MLDLDLLKLASLSELRLSVDEMTYEPRAFFQSYVCGSLATSGGHDMHLGLLWIKVIS